jgi:hypothetical protein
MKQLIPIASLLVAVLLATPSVASTPTRAGGAAIDSSAAASLRSAEAKDLGTLRAGVGAAKTSIGAAERTSLAAADARSKELGALRGGDITLSDKEVTIIVVVAVVVLILILV